MDRCRSWRGSEWGRGGEAVSGGGEEIEGTLQSGLQMETSKSLKGRKKNLKRN